METFSALLAICAGNWPVTGEFPTQRPLTRSFDVFFDLRLNKRSSKRAWGWWFETLSRPLWRHCNVAMEFRLSCTKPSKSTTFDSQWTPKRHFIAHPKRRVMGSRLIGFWRRLATYTESLVLCFTDQLQCRIYSWFVLSSFSELVQKRL